MTRLEISAACAALALSASGPVVAGEVSGNVAIVSNYYFRGLTQTGNDPGLQGAVTYAADSGFYIGTSAESISWLEDAADAYAPGRSASASLEWDGFAGFKGNFGDSPVTFDTGVVYYGYPADLPSGMRNPGTAEAFFGVGFGVMHAKLNYALTDFFATPAGDDSQGSTALEVGAAFALAPTWDASVTVGHQWLAGAPSDADWTWWSAGVSKGFAHGFSLGAMYVDSDLDAAPNEKGRFVFRAGKAF